MLGLWGVRQGKSPCGAVKEDTTAGRYGISRPDRRVRGKGG